MIQFTVTGKLLFFKILPGTRWPLHSGPSDFSQLALPIATPFPVQTTNDFDYVLKPWTSCSTHVLQLVAVLFTECRDGQVQCRDTGRCLWAASNYCNGFGACDDDSDEPAGCSE